MNGFRIGFIAALSFLLVVAVFSGTLGYFPPPEGPKAPEYPDYSDLSPFSQTLNILNPGQVQQFDQAQPVPQEESEYDKAMKEYDKAREKYEEEQKTFVEKEIIPYARNVFVAWIGIQTLFVLIGILFIKINSDLVGSGFAFSSVWTIFFLPLGGIIWYASVLISSFATRAEETYSADPILQAIMWTSVAGVLLLTIFGNMLYGIIPLSKRRVQIPQQQTGV